MNILIIHQYFLEKESGGGSRFNQFAKYWAKKGHKVNVIAGTVDYTTGKKNQEYKRKFVVKKRIDKNITVFRCHVSEAYNKSFVGRLWAYFSFTLSSTWAGLLYIHKQDIIIATSPPLFVAVPAYILKKLKKIPLIFEIRDLWPKFAIDTGVLKNSLIIRFSYWLENFIYKKADLINALTPAFEQYLIDEKSILKQKIVDVPNAADLDIFQPGERNNWIRGKYKWKDKFVILYIGAHGVANDIWQIINVAELLKNDHDILFVLVGAGMEKEKLKKTAQEKQLNNIQFIDSVSKHKVPDFINAADVCTAILSPVFTTTYPNKVFDYMACAKPIILPIDGAIRKLSIDQARAGIFIQPRDAKKFKNAIIELKNNAEKCKHFGENGYKFVIKNFDRKKLATKYLKIISKLIKK